MFLQQAEFIDRANFGKFLNSRKMYGTAVEIGTHLGRFSQELLEHWQGSLLCCVDPWAKIPGYDLQERCLPDKGITREDDFNSAKRLLAPHKNRVRFLRMLSVDAAQSCEDGSLDFVYLDGDHSYEGVKSDLTLWWPKLRSGGILAGHDFVCPGEKIDTNWGRFIQPAVSEFATPQNLTVYLVIEHLSLPWSYYMEKP